jgi:hypothetical protein
MLSDLHVLDLEQQRPTWQQVQPRLLAADSKASSCTPALTTGRGGTIGAGSSTPSSALLPLAGHAGKQAVCSSVWLWDPRPVQAAVVSTETTDSNWTTIM